MIDTDMSEATPMSLGSQLCTRCGLCCTGALHDTATAESDEVEALRGRGADIIAVEKLYFGLPCPCLRGTRCGIYEERPRVCSRYRCRLLQDTEAGTMALSDAKLKVHEARRLFDEVKRLIPAGMSVPQARAKCRDRQASIEPRLRLQMMALMRYLDLHFRHDEEGPMLRDEVLTMMDSKATKEESQQQHV